MSVRRRSVPTVVVSSAMGGCIYPIQEEEGYDPAFATAVNIASCAYRIFDLLTSAFIVILQ